MPSVKTTTCCVWAVLRLNESTTAVFFSESYCFRISTAWSIPS